MSESLTEEHKNKKQIITSSKLCLSVLMSESFDRRTKEQKLTVPPSKLCPYVVVSELLYEFAIFWRENMAAS